MKVIGRYEHAHFADAIRHDDFKRVCHVRQHDLAGLHRHILEARPADNAAGLRIDQCNIACVIPRDLGGTAQAAERMRGHLQRAHITDLSQRHLCSHGVRAVQADVPVDHAGSQKVTESARVGQLNRRAVNIGHRGVSIHGGQSIAMAPPRP